MGNSIKHIQQMQKNIICVPHIHNCGIPLIFLTNPFPVKSYDIPGFIKIISGY
jgi:hypothetical protein